MNPTWGVVFAGCVISGCLGIALGVLLMGEEFKAEKTESGVPCRST